MSLLTEDQKHYIGGIIDGEGSISGRENNGHNSFDCIILSSTNLEFVHRIRSILGDYNTYIRINRHKNNPNWKQEYKLNLSQKSDNLLPFLEEIKEYTVLKKPRIELLQQIVMNIDRKKNMKKLKLLNQRGYNPDNIELLITKKSEYTPAYCAGIMDGEGYFCITKRNYRKNSFHCKISPLTSTSGQLVNYIKKALPYDLRVDRRIRSPMRKPVYETYISSSYFIDYINDIYPFLILKKSHSQAFKQFRLGENKLENYVRLKELNRRGVYT